MTIYLSSFGDEHPLVSGTQERLVEIHLVESGSLENSNLDVPDLVTLAYRLVVARRAHWALLSSIRGDGKATAYAEIREAAAEIRRAASELCPDSDQPLRAASELLETRLHGLEPPLVWDAWIRTVHESRLIRLADEVRK